MENIDDIINKILINIRYEPKKTLSENRNIILETYAYADKNSKTITLQGNINCEQTGAGSNAMELQLPKGAVFKKIGNQLVTSNQNVNLLHDYIPGYTVETWKGVTIRINCSTKEVKVDGHGNTFVGENWTPQFNGIVSEACSWKDETPKQEVSTPEVSTPEVSTPEVSTPEVSTPPQKTAQEISAEQCALDCNQRLPYYSVVCDGSNWKTTLKSWINEKGGGKDKKTYIALRTSWCSGWRPGQTPEKLNDFIVPIFPDSATTTTTLQQNNQASVF